MGVRRTLIILLNTIIILCLLALIALTIYGFVRYRQINTLVEQYFTIAFGVLLGVMVLIILVAVCAICLSNSDSRCCCFIYCVLALILSLFFIGIGIAALRVPPILLGDNCTSNQYFTDLQRFSELAQSSICFTCPCYFPLSVIQSTYSAAETVALTPMIPLASSVDSSLPVQAQACAGWDTTNLTNAYRLMNFLETNFKCTGWCSNTTSLFYRFTNVSNGIPQNTCYNSLKEKMGPISRAISIPTIVIGSLIFLSFFLFLFICCVDKEATPRIPQQNTASHYDMNRMPQLTAQNLQRPPDMTGMTGTFNPGNYGQYGYGKNSYY